MLIELSPTISAVCQALFETNSKLLDTFPPLASDVMSIFDEIATKYEKLTVIAKTITTITIAPTLLTAGDTVYCFL